jgi:hypothetical protein
VIVAARDTRRPARTVVSWEVVSLSSRLPSV